MPQSAWRLTGTDVAIQASDLTSVSGDLRAAGEHPARASYAADDQREPVVDLAYNVAAIPPAVAALSNPIIAAAAMACSSLFVVSNSLRAAALPERTRATS